MLEPAVSSRANSFPRRSNGADVASTLYVTPREIGLAWAFKWHKSTVFGWATASFAVAAACLLLTRPQYTATAQLLLGVGAGMQSRSAERDPRAQRALIESELQTLQTDRIAQLVIDKLGLWRDAELAGEDEGLLSQVFALAAWRDSAAASPAVRRDKVLDRFKQATGVERSGQSYVAKVSFSASSPHKAAVVANSLAAAYVAEHTATQTRGVDQIGERIERRIAKAREKALAASATLASLQDGPKPKQKSDANAQARLRQLESEAQTYHSIYKALLEQYAEAMRERATPVTEARVISNAAPPSRWDSERLSLVLLLSACAGGLLGLLIAAHREGMKRPIRSLQQVEKEVGIQPLGAVPLVAGRRLYPAPGHAPPLLLHDRGDALRGVRVAVGEMCRGHGSCVVGVISAHREEGKSTIAFNLAVLEAESGKRVILIDANLHRPALARSLPCGTLLAQLEGRAAVSAAAASNEFGFDLLGERASEPPMHPAVLLGSPAMRELIAAARERYDFIVCDLPNIGEHVDARAAADLFDAFVLVMEWGSAPTARAKATLKSSAIADRLVGGLINKAPRRMDGFV